MCRCARPTPFRRIDAAFRHLFCSSRVPAFSSGRRGSPSECDSSDGHEFVETETPGRCWSQRSARTRPPPGIWPRAGRPRRPRPGEARAEPLRHRSPRMAMSGISAQSEAGSSLPQPSTSLRPSCPPRHRPPTTTASATSDAALHEHKPPPAASPAPTGRRRRRPVQSTGGTPAAPDVCCAALGSHRPPG